MGNKMNADYIFSIRKLWKAVIIKWQILQTFSRSWTAVSAFSLCCNISSRIPDVIALSSSAIFIVPCSFISNVSRSAFWKIIIFQKIFLSHFFLMQNKGRRLQEINSRNEKTGKEIQAASATVPPQAWSGRHFKVNALPTPLPPTYASP